MLPRPTTEQFLPPAHAFGAYARPALRKGEGSIGRVRFTYRYYNPTDGRWTRRDPIGIEGGVNLYGYIKNNYIGNVDIMGKAPQPKEPIFIFPYNSYGDVAIGIPDKEHFVKFHAAIKQLSEKTKADGTKCYKIVLHLAGAVNKEQIKKGKCDSLYIIAHGKRENGKEYVLLKDGFVSLDELRKSAKKCIGIGCYIGKNRGKISQVAAFLQLVDEIKTLAEADCPCEQQKICIASGPINSYDVS